MLLWSLPSAYESFEQGRDTVKQTTVHYLPLRTQPLLSGAVNQMPGQS